jgi:hypothetical protein
MVRDGGSCQLRVAERVDGFDTKLKSAATIVVDGKVLQHRRTQVDVPGCRQPSDDQRMHPMMVGILTVERRRAVAGCSADAQPGDEHGP